MGRKEKEMKSISEILKESTELQKFASKRGLEFIIASGCKRVLYKTPDTIELNEDSINMVFSENTSHDCPNKYDVTLNISDLEKTDDEWSVYITQIKKKVSDKEAEEKRRLETRILEAQRNEYERLKKIFNED